MPSFSGRVDQDLKGDLRLDRYIAEHLKLLSRSQIRARDLSARLDGKQVKISRLLRGGEELELSWAESEPLYLIHQDLPLDVVYEDSKVIVINKAQGMVVHPGAGNREGTLANALLFRRNQKTQSQSTSSANLRPGIVHRLDKDTSGLIISAWDEGTHAFLTGQFKDRKVKKSYAALVKGRPPQSQGLVNWPIGRSRRDRKIFSIDSTRPKPSQTYYKLVKSYGNYSLLLLRPRTGRTHQLRVHLAALGLPILGDPLYGRRDEFFPKAGLMLHSKRLRILLPDEGERRLFTSPLPDRFIEIIHALTK